MKRYLYKLVSETLGNMLANGQIRALPKFAIEDILVPKENFGDYSLNIALVIARESGEQPNDIADIIAREIKALDKQGAFKDLQVLNGFINIYVSTKYLAQNIIEQQDKVFIDQIGIKDDGSAIKVVFEYSSPNTNKPLHIGHTRNDLFGMAAINLLRATGHDVISCEIINDRGIHIMKSMLMYMKFGEERTPETEAIKPDHFVGMYYAMFETQNQKLKPASAKQEEAAALTKLEQEAQELLQKWEAGDSKVRALWEKMNNWFYEGVKATYAKEGSVFDEVQHESAIFDKGKDLVLQGVKKGLFKKDEDGSIFVNLTEQKLDKKYLLRKDGTTLYITQDIYLWQLRDELHHPDLAVVTTSAEQAYHFAVLKNIFKLLGFKWAGNFAHLPYEHVYLGRNKMSSRAGNAVSADDLLEQTKAKVRETMRNSEKIKASADDEALVEAIAFAAIKYAYLKYDRNTKIYFDLEQTIAIEGNTGPYLQYTYARINSIFEKAGKFRAQSPNDLNSEPEKQLMRFLLHYPETITAAAKDFRPSLLCAYLFDLASKFNTFYDQVSVLNAETESIKEQRLALLQAVAVVLKNGLELLGIKVVEKM